MIITIPSNTTSVHMPNIPTNIIVLFHMVLKYTLLIKTGRTSNMFVQPLMVLSTPGETNLFLSKQDPKEEAYIFLRDFRKQNISYHKNHTACSNMTL